ncbi:hypothetical protein SASPL_125331 [Salvia splendens]|uniref:Uncharacterized protein n=1 Tax=Salvia splendens TaxID=180675 RepID=A0A8X8ZPY4_SALSN|nr:hypothetical protein SASPL_125331 [Salvia splendens]
MNNCCLIRARQLKFRNCTFCSSVGPCTLCPSVGSSFFYGTGSIQIQCKRNIPTSSKDDAFFDSQPWLESDCEDDFLSVNGDFTPSRGSTPVHHRFSSGNPTVNKPPPVPEPSPKKRLSELFKESLRHQQGGDKEDDTSEESVVVENGASSGKSGNGAEEKSVQCCLPRLRSRRTFATAQVEKV